MGRLLLACCALLVVAGCGGTASESPPQETKSPEPTGSLTVAEQQYVEDIRADVDLLSDVHDVMTRMLDSYPDWSPQVQADADTLTQELSSLAADWEAPPPSVRLERAQRLWLRVIQHSSDTLTALEKGTSDGLSESTAQMDLSGKYMDRLSDEFDSLEAL